MPKRVVDVMSCEVAKAVKLTAKTIEYVSFKVPRKNGSSFQPDLFPPCRSIEPAMKFEEYWTGVDKDPVRMEMKLDQKEHTFSPQRRSTFLSKLGDKSQPTESSTEALRQPLSVQPTAVAQQNTAQLEEFKTEIDTLTQKVEELSESLSQSQRENVELQERINLLVNENQQLKGEL